jgi:hypothetical protein
MPLDSLLVSAGVCFVFLLFAAVLAWADYRTTSWMRSRGQPDQSKNSTDASHLKKVA